MPFFIVGSNNMLRPPSPLLLEQAEQFDARLAAVRMALHFEEKLILFGEEKLVREILLSDLNDDDMECLKTGYIQVMKELDFGNRKVIFYYKAGTSKVKV